MSTKSFDHTGCRLSKDVFKIAGEPSFYERFGFVNESYQDFMNYLRSMQFEECIRQLSLRTNEYYHAALKVLARTHNLNKKSTLQEIAAYVVRNCKQKSRHNTEYSRRSSKSMVKTRKFSQSKETFFEEWVSSMMTFLTQKMKEKWKKHNYINPAWTLKVLPDYVSNL